MALARGAIRHMLKNPLYLGLIRSGKEFHQGQHIAIVDQEQFDAVQAALDSQSPGERARAKRPSSSLLKGIAFDGNGYRLQPNFCNKQGKRYRYYTSAKRLKDTRADPQGMRIPAGDLERLVIGAIADRLQDKPKMQRWLRGHIPIGNVPSRLNALSVLAAAISNAKQSYAEQIREILERVTVSKTTLEIQLSERALMETINIPQNGTELACQSNEQKSDDISASAPNIIDNESPLAITISSHLLRSGKQVKLILGNEKNEATEPNPRLVTIVAKTRHWFDGLKSGRYPTIKHIALDEKCDKSYVGRLLSIAFLAPDIVERILAGDHSAALTPERLRKACPLPQRWEDQRALLLH